MNYSFGDLCMYFFGVYLLILIIAYLFLRKRDVEPRQIEAYVVMGEEIFALPYWEKTEESDFADKVFFLTNDIVRAIIILVILFGSAYKGYLTFID